MHDPLHHEPHGHPHTADVRGQFAQLSPDGLLAALTRLRRLDAALTPSPACESGVRVEFLRGPRLDCIELPPDPDFAVVFGGHPACRFRVEGGRDVASRHALLIPSATSPSLDFVDLARRPASSWLLATSTEHVVGFGAGLLRIHSTRADGRVGVRVRRPAMLSGCEFDVVSEPMNCPDRDGEPALVQLELRRGGLRISRSIRASELVDGLLLARDHDPLPDDEPAGSYDVARSFARLTRRLSRAHLLLRREGTDIVAYDLDSSPGTYFNERAIRRLVLPSAGVELQLGNPHTGVHLAIRPV